MQSRPAIGSTSHGAAPPGHRGSKHLVRFSDIGILAGMALLAAGCADIRPHVPPSEGHITKPQARPAEPVKAIPPPARVSTFVPPPKPAIKPQTYSVVVNEVPVKELLLALARDTKQNIDIHPGIAGLVSLNAINETLPAILERISKQVNLRYRVEGNTIIVSPDAPYVKTYRVNYVNTTRTITSTISVSGEVGTSSGVGSPGGAQGAQSGSRTEVTSRSNNDFWEQLRDNIHSILVSTRRIAASSEEKAVRAEEDKAAREDALKRAEAVSRAGAGASELLKSAFPQQQQRPSAAQAQSDSGKDVIVNPISGTITVLGTDQQHQLIQQHLDSITSAVQRQVLIEATIVEVVLSEGYQGGIDWSRLAVSGGITFTQALLGGFNAAALAAGAAAGNAFTIGYQNPNSDVGNISVTIKLLQEFGNTRVLSSPKVMAINNQTALLKVVDNIVYFEIQAQQGVTTTTGTITAPTFNSTAKTVAVGMVMGVTPQINEDGRVTLTVRPTISRILRFVNDPNPSLIVAGTRIPNPVPEIQVREMESVLQVGSGQTVILGGLMQDEVGRSREQLPGADKVGDAGELFRFRNERAVKTELVIFLRPTVIPNPSLASDELKFFQRFLPQPETPPAASTGPAQ